MSAEIGEEIRIEWNGLAGKDGFCCVEQQALCLGARIFLLIAGINIRQRSTFQRLAIDLARAQTRQTLNNLKARWQHIRRHILRERHPQCHAVDLNIGIRNDEGHKPINPIILT